MPCTVLWRLLLLSLIVVAPVSLASADEGPTLAETVAESVAKAMAEDDEKEDKDAKQEDDEQAKEKASDKKESEDKAEAKDEDEKKPDDSDAKQEEDGDKDDDSDKEEKKPERKTLSIKKKPLKIEVEVSGSVISETMTEVALDSETWSSFEIEEIVPHGAKVRAGETLVRFDPEDLDEAIEELELSQRLSELSLMQMEQDLPRREEELERRLKDAKTDWEETQEDYERYTDEERDLIVKMQDMRLKQSKFQLDYANDELEQLEKMYEADDLTEETEEMILRRQRTQLEFSKFSYELAKYNNEVTLGSSLPRQDERMKQMNRRVELALERLKDSTELDLSRTRYELEQARKSRKKSLEKHSDLTADKRLMTIKAPKAGVVYYGRCVNGKWGETTSLKQKLLPEKSAPKGTVLMTIVDPENLTLLATVKEEDLPTVEDGQPVELSLTAKGVDPIEAKVGAVDRVPATAGKFDVTIDITGDTPDWLLPGMTGKAKILTYEKKKAVLVPKDAVHKDEDADKHYVWLVEEEDDETEVEKQWVKLGKTDDKEIEILKGLKEGDVISVDPKEKGTDDGDEDKDDDDSDD
ncbi:macrolide transporter subunit MacA [Posidoniimonas polymericola]|uniref:Macrolide transporter subunit MacA n=1 Tax=Posidoniimonas polymericola TaxID=2528002 RepID=A0A5C5ZFK5_9BACT|nr:HlyD family efflux transporter periplasmic adaptor subunit [Posidoniimonas polymericola]TWT85807.1 macrolide transporter subunit MacA [Posidoniimonas polymericola]